MSQIIVRKAFKDLGFTPLYGTYEVAGNEKNWIVELPTEQAKAMEDDGFDIGWVQATEDTELAKARRHVQELAEIFK